MFMDVEHGVNKRRKSDKQIYRQSLSVPRLSLPLGRSSRAPNLRGNAARSTDLDHYHATTPNFQYCQIKTSRSPPDADHQDQVRIVAESCNESNTTLTNNNVNANILKNNSHPDEITKGLQNTINIFSIQAITRLLFGLTRTNPSTSCIAHMYTSRCSSLQALRRQR